MFSLAHVFFVLGFWFFFKLNSEVITRIKKLELFTIKSGFLPLKKLEDLATWVYVLTGQQGAGPPCDGHLLPATTSSPLSPSPLHSFSWPACPESVAPDMGSQALIQQICIEHLLDANSHFTGRGGRELFTPVDPVRISRGGEGS